MNTEMNIQHETTPGYPVGFNNLLERQRESLHLNREEAAETLGITADRLEALETGKTVDAVASELVDIRSAYGLSGEFLLDVFEANRAVVVDGDTTDQIENMVNNFLSWKLPKEFAPDCGIEFTPPEAGSPEHFWPVGTNLLNADQAREMIKHILSETES